MTRTDDWSVGGRQMSRILSTRYERLGCSDPSRVPECQLNRLGKGGDMILAGELG